MHDVQRAAPHPVEMIQKALGKPLNPGEIGVLMAFAGVGKTACLTHIAVESLIHGFPVLHVCIDETPDKIKIWYGEFLKNILGPEHLRDVPRIQQHIEPLRFIHAYLHHTFSPAKLDQSLQNLREQAQFQAAVVVLDGLDFDRISRASVQDIKDSARKQGVSVWMSARMHRHLSIINERGIPYPCHEMDDLFDAIVLLEPIPDVIRVKVLKYGGRYFPGRTTVLLNPQTYLLQPH